VNPCKNCIYWLPIKESEGKAGLCRRYPPTPLLQPHPIQGLSLNMQNPVMPPDGTCGEWWDGKVPDG